MLKCFNRRSAISIPIVPVLAAEYQKWLEQQDEFVKNCCARLDVKGSLKHVLLSDEQGKPSKVICLIDDWNDPWNFAGLAKGLPAGVYQLQSEQMTAQQHENAAIAWGLTCYQFTRYQDYDGPLCQLLLQDDNQFCLQVDSIVSAIYLVRDLINTPCADLGPAELAHEVANLAHNFSAQTSQVVGKELLSRNYPAIYHVGKASEQDPRLLELTWGQRQHPLVTLVGKGVCFDSGGLNIKTGSGMRLMKKDMGGAAHVLGLARMIMAANLPVQLRVLIPAVENAISSSAYRPGDVIKTRKGLQVEVGNTDAEGRLVLADALHEACQNKNALLIDFATLTGAARVALGTEVPVFFTNDEQVAKQIESASEAQRELVWRLPLYAGYRSQLDSPIADLNNDAGGTGYGGAITAALFLQEFITKETPWVHFDLMAWNLKSKPGRQEGGEAMGLRAMFAMLQQWISA